MDYEDSVTLQHSIYWLLAFIHQGERVSRAWNMQEGQHSPFLNTRMMEEHFLLVACNKARRWLEKLKTVVEDKQPILEFFEITKNSVIIRHKREHDDEYFGTGKRHDEEPNHDVQSRSPIRMNVGTSCSCYLNGRLLLGGIFDVGNGIEAAGSLQNRLRKLQHAYWDERGRGEAGHFKMPEKLMGC